MMSKMWATVVVFYSLFLQGVISNAPNTGHGDQRTPFLRRELPKDTILRPSFAEWTKLINEFPQCDPTRNPYKSPINIVRSEAIEDSDLKSIIVHGGPPADECLFLSTIHKEDDLEMEVVNIFPDSVCQEHNTFISGAGEGPRDLRYFRRAFIFFPGGNIISPQSLHQFNGESFDMEIAMEFVSINEIDVTEIHLMVKALPESDIPVNPVFKSIEDALIELKSEMADEASGNSETSKKLKELKDKCDDADQRYLKALEEYKKMGESGAKLNDKLQKLEKIISSIKYFRDSNLTALIEEVDKIKKTPLEEELDTLLDERDDLIELMDKGKNKTGELKETVKKIADLKNGIKSEKELELDNMLKLLAHSKVGIPGKNNSSGVLFKSPDAVYKERKRIQKIFNQLGIIQESYEKACKVYANYKAIVRFAYVPIEGPFKISWLFPHTAGYFHYQGSNPIPKCERTSHSLVYDTPINITIEQLRLFHELPSLSNSSSSRLGGGSGLKKALQGGTTPLPPCKIVPVSVPDGHPGKPQVKQQKVRHVKKKTTFLKDDGLHVKSSHDGKPRPGKGLNGRSLMISDDFSSSVRIYQQEKYIIGSGCLLYLTWAWLSTWVK